MNTRYYTLLLVIMTVMMSSCTEWLSIQPAGKVVSNNYWKTESDVENVVAACYRSMVEDSYIKKLIVYGELRSDNVTLGYTSVDELNKINEGNILPANSYASWSNFYQVINYCNIILHYAPNAQEIDPNFSLAKLNAKMAEVLAIRALNYFYLVRAFGPVPYVINASLSESQDYEIAQSSEDVILDGLEADLIKAEGWAMTSYGSTASNKGRITKNAIRALLADIYLWRNKYDECVTYCDKIISDKSLSLIPAKDDPYQTIFGEKNSKESIFELQFSSTNFTYNGAVNSFYGSKGSEAGTLTAVIPTVCENKELFELNSDGEYTDLRRKDYITSKDQSKMIYNIFKYGGSYRTESSDGITSRYNYRDPNSDPANWIIYRLPDVMLMKAEALVQEGSFLPALQLVNTTYMRSHPTFSPTDTLDASSFTTKREMEELVLKERQRELLFEGKRWYDLMRMARRDSSTNRLLVKVLSKYTDNIGEIGSKLKDMNALYFPIHESELISNSKLVQNPYYDKEY